MYLFGLRTTLPEFFDRLRSCFWNRIYLRNCIRNNLKMPSISSHHLSIRSFHHVRPWCRSISTDNPNWAPMILTINFHSSTLSSFQSRQGSSPMLLAVSFAKSFLHLLIGFPFGQEIRPGW